MITEVEIGEGVLDMKKDPETKKHRQSLEAEERKGMDFPLRVSRMKQPA